MHHEEKTVCINIKEPEQKNCAGNCCSNEGVHKLKIIYLNKVGWFCDHCKDDIVKNNLYIQQET